MASTSSSYWNQRPNFGDEDDDSCSNKTSDSGPSETQTSGQDSQNSSNSSQRKHGFDYVHFAQFLAVRNIKIIPHSDIKYEHPSQAPLGKGAAMQVQMATWKNELVAVKTVRAFEATQSHRSISMENWLHDLYFELQVMSHRPLCEHPNVVQLKGISFDDEDDENLHPVLLVEPACRDHADLTRFVLSRSENLEPVVAANLISDVADGLTVLHVYGVVHGDLKPENILIFQHPDGLDGFKAKICDFGFSGSRLSEDSPRGYTPAWAAPECFLNAPHALHEYRNQPSQDIFSFALVLAFVLLRQCPRASEHQHTKDIIEIGLKGLASEYAWIPKIIPITLQCLGYQPSDRPKSLSGVRKLITGRQLDDTGMWDVALTPFRRDLAREADESRLTNFALHNATFLRHIFLDLPSTIQDKIIQQIQNELQNNGSSQRMLAAYRTLRVLRPEMPAIEGTDTSLEQDNNDFARLLQQSYSPASQILNRLTNGNYGDISKWNVDPNCILPSAMKDSDLAEFRMAPSKGGDRHSPKILEEMKAFQSLNRFGYVSAASHAGNALLLKQLLEIGASPEDHTAVAGAPLREAVLHHHHECARILLQYNANTETLLSVPTSSNYTPLVAASMSGDTEMTSILLKYNADPWHRVLDSLQNTAAHICAIASFSPAAACLNLLLKHDQRLALARNSHLRTPLHYAAMTGNVECIEALLEAHADANCTDINGKTPLHYAWIAAINLQDILAEHFPEKLQNEVHRMELAKSALIAQSDNLRPLDAIKILTRANANSEARDFNNDTPKSSAFLMLLATIGLGSVERLSSNPVSWCRTPVSPWYSNLPRNTSSENSNLSFRVAMSPCISRIWFLDVSPVCPTFGYYLTATLGKLDNSWNDASVKFTVYSWDRSSQSAQATVLTNAMFHPAETLGGSVIYHDSSPDLQLEFEATIGELITETGFLYHYKLGLVNLQNKCDVLVEVQVDGAPPRGGGRLVLGHVQFHLEPDFDIRARNQIQSHPNLPDIELIEQKGGGHDAILFKTAPLVSFLPQQLYQGFPWNQLAPRCQHWNKSNCPDLRDFDLNGVFLSPQRHGWLAFLILCALVQLTIASAAHWWRYLLLFFTYNMAKRAKFQRQVEVFKKGDDTSNFRGYGTLGQYTNDRKDSRPSMLLYLLLRQEAYLVVIYCFWNSFSNAFSLLVGHVALCFVLRNQLANNTVFHVLCPLGVELELIMVVLITQMMKAIFG